MDRSGSTTVATPDPITSNRDPSTRMAVFSSMPTPMWSGASATAASSLGSRPRSAKCMSMSTPPSRPRPGAVRTAAAETSARWPPRIIVRPSAVAPALVPAITSPPASRSRRISFVRDPTSARIRDWSPPLKKTPVAPRRMDSARSLSASARPRSRSSVVFSTPSLRNTCSYSACTSSGMPVAVVTSVIRAWSPPDSSTNRSSTPAPQQRSSPPPMMKSRPAGIPSLTWGKLPKVDRT